MKQLCFFFIIFVSASINPLAAQWKPDILEDGFEQLIIQMPDDYEGAVNCVLVRHHSEQPVKKAVLYIHGFNDYFFQKEQAFQYNEHGYAFFAVDLRKYGRSYLPHQKRCNVRKLNEYYADIDTCLNLILEQGYDEIILTAHSTGGLISCIYAHDQKDHLKINGIILNSPFLDMNLSKILQNIGVPVVSIFSIVFPNAKLNSGDNNTYYGKSIHKDYFGEWEYNLLWKPINSIPIYFSWIHAIHQGHTKVQKGLNILCPILVMHSDKSVYGDKWSDEFTKGDAVLSVIDINKYAARLGKDVTTLVVHEGLHDLILSRKDVRENVYNSIFLWLKAKNL